MSEPLKYLVYNSPGSGFVQQAKRPYPPKPTLFIT